MLKKLARWILKEELKQKDELYLNQVNSLNDDYNSRIKELEEQHNRELMILGKHL